MYQEAYQEVYQEVVKEGKGKDSLERKPNYFEAVVTADQKLV